jgi:MFS family permease
MITEPTTAAAAPQADAAPVPPAPARAAALPFVLLLTALTALGQFGSNVFLPGLPALTQELRSTGSIAAQAYTVYLLVFGAGQLVMGRHPAAWRWTKRTLCQQGYFAGKTTEYTIKPEGRFMLYKVTYALSLLEHQRREPMARPCLPWRGEHQRSGAGCVGAGFVGGGRRCVWCLSTGLSRV